MAVHVLWVIKGLGPGGAERLLVALAGAHDPEVATFECAFVVPWKDHLVADLEARGVRCHCLSTSRRDPRWPIRLARLARSSRFDVVHVHSPLPGSIARLAARSVPKARRPVLFTTEHNAWRTFRRPTRWLNRLTNRADRFTFAVSAEVAGSLRGPVVERSTVLVHGIDLPSVRAAAGGRAAMRAALGVGDDEFLFVTVANHRAQKDYPNLLAACARLRAHGVPFRLAAVGQGPLEDAARALHAELGLGDSVLLLGYRADSVDVLAAADAFVMASKWEGLPVALMEACALGLPCVLTEVGGMPDALGPDGARWVPPADASALAAAMAEVAGDAALRADLAAHATTAGEQFDVRRAAREIERHYVPPVPSWDAPVGLEGIEVRRAGPGEEAAAIALCQQVLGHADDAAWPALFQWKHRENPFGTSPMWVAVDDGRIVAVRVFMRWQFRHAGRVIDAVRAVDTATDPAYQGKGLFTALTLQGLSELEAEGVEMVFNTPNTQSRPGYLKMGWQVVGRLRPAMNLRSPVALPRVMRSRVPASLFPDEPTVGVPMGEWLDGGGLDRFPLPSGGGLRTAWTPDTLRWRFGAAVQPCRVVDDGHAAIVVERRRRGQVTELVCLLALGPTVAADRLLRRTVRRAGADVALRLGPPRPHAGFLPVPGAGPILTCRMLRPEPTPPLDDWDLELGSVVLF
ncbi:MAG: GNAT family N-acetyltransferase [Ilumatobacter sp.]|nr:GNAT family N-acetyltransferase [Ilumatobacter sp.]